MMKSIRKTMLRMTALFLAACLLPLAASAGTQQDDWVKFLLICNEGMNNDQGNAGNTLMVAAMNPVLGRIHLMMFTWDTFIDYEGYDLPQRLDMPYRNNGPEEAMKVFNENFGLDIDHYLSLNYLNLASLIDEYGGVNVDITRAERNALNGMVASKKVRLQEEVAAGFLGQVVIDMLAQEYYLNDFGQDIHLNGLQAVGYGWLQYDSVYNCCVRDAEVIAELFRNAGAFITRHVTLYTDDIGLPDSENLTGRRPINLDHVSDEDYAYLRQLISPIFQMSYNNLTEEEIRSITLSLAHVAFQATREGADVFDSLRTNVLPLEATQPYEIIGGAEGHLVDKEANMAAIREFLFSDD